MDADEPDYDADESLEDAPEIDWEAWKTELNAAKEASG